MEISFTVAPSDLVGKLADAGEIPALIRALINSDYYDDIVAQLDTKDILDSVDRDDVKDWAVNNFNRADLFDDENVLDEMDHGDILDYVRNNVDDARIVDLLDDLSASEILDHLVANGETDAIKDCAQQNELLPAGNTASNGDLLTEVMRRLTDGSMEADDVLDVLTQSGRLVIRTVYHTK
jgi:hypothetical protein